MPDREKVISEFSECVQRGGWTHCGNCEYKNANVLLTCEPLAKEILALLQEQEAVVHPEPSCEMTYITNCCCDLCGVQLIREDNYCRCCGKRIEWEGR